MAYEAIAVLTNEAKRRLAEMWVTGKSYQVKYFTISSGGHDPTDPTIALAVDPSSTSPPGLTIFGPQSIDAYEWTSDYCPIFVCKILPGEMTGPVSNVSLWGEIVHVPPGDTEPLGTRFLFAVYNRPLLVMTGTDSAEFRISIFM